MQGQRDAYQKTVNYSMTHPVLGSALRGTPLVYMNHAKLLNLSTNPHKPVNGLQNVPRKYLQFSPGKTCTPEQRQRREGSPRT